MYEPHVFKVTNVIVDDLDKLTEMSQAVACGTCVEIGSNENGHWVKFGNGMMICYKDVTATVDVDTPWGSLFRSPTSRIQLGQFAQPFLDGTTPSVSIALTGSSDGILSTLTGVTNTGMGGVLIFRGTATTGATYTISVTAIGRWK